MNVFLIPFVAVLFALPLSAQVVSGVVTDDNLLVNENTVIEPGAWVVTDKMTVENSVVVENYGRIETNIVVDSVDLYLKNYADFNSDFYLNDGARVFQVISSADSFNLIDFNVDYGVIIDGVYDELNFSDVSNFAIGAQSVFIKNSVLNFNDVDLADLRNVNLTVAGTVVLKLDDLSEIYDDILFDDVYGSAQIVLLSENQDNLFSKFAYLSGGKLYVGQRRETDYVKIFNNELGLFLNDLRDMGEASNLMHRLDSAQSMYEINDIMSQSVLFDAKRLIYPAKVLNLLNKNHFINEWSGADAFMLFADDFDVYGLNLNLVTSDKDGFLFNVVGQIATMKYSSDLDSFDAMNYSVAVGAKTPLWYGLSVDAKIGIGITDFNVGNVLYSGRIYNNPILMSGFALTDLKYDFKLNDYWFVSPFVGGEYNVYDIESLNQKYLLYRCGVEMRYTHEIMGLRYVYGARFVANSDDEYAASVNGKFWSVADMIGAGLEVATVYVDDELGYRVSARFDVNF